MRIRSTLTLLFIYHAVRDRDGFTGGISHRGRDGLGFHVNSPLTRYHAIRYT